MALKTAGSFDQVARDIQESTSELMIHTKGVSRLKACNRTATMNNAHSMSSG
jgi:hypothetical protein